MSKHLLLDLALRKHDKHQLLFHYWKLYGLSSYTVFKARRKLLWYTHCGIGKPMLHKLPNEKIIPGT